MPAAGIMQQDSASLLNSLNIEFPVYFGRACCRQPGLQSNLFLLNCGRTLPDLELIQCRCRRPVAECTCRLLHSGTSFHPRDRWNHTPTWDQARQELLLLQHIEEMWETGSSGSEASTVGASTGIDDLESASAADSAGEDSAGEDSAGEDLLEDEIVLGAQLDESVLDAQQERPFDCR
mmetsp:Transcript_47605/g.92054  ORF Transcript_47605/g.92054 Transcript_47605/m.92054 type:complete len:178 (+) Transcript_47605:48-581(+)